MKIAFIFSIVVLACIVYTQANPVPGHHKEDDSKHAKKHEYIKDTGKKHDKDHKYKDKKEHDHHHDKKHSHRSAKESDVVHGYGHADKDKPHSPSKDHDRSVQNSGPLLGMSW